MRSLIETRLQTLFLAESGLDGIKVFFRGEPLRIQHYPVVVIFVQQQRVLSQETGLWVYEYDGYLAVEDQIPDHYTVSNRTATIPSYTNVATYLDLLSDVIEANQSMASVVTDSNEKGRVIRVSGEKTYGLQERADSINNRGEFPFVVQTQKLRS